MIADRIRVQPPFPTILVATFYRFLSIFTTPAYARLCPTTIASFLPSLAAAAAAEAPATTSAPATH